ncbi:aldehyde dehydrogenase (NAD+) [Spirosomataceae bacterium TFI 002]|nr:aldehyde dehydrogenase (NAD+) [Spirosomataceae bacterium TFI 002]
MNLIADNVSVEQINKIFAAQKANQYAVANTTVKERKAKLKALKKAVEVTYRQDIRDAMMADFKKPSADVDLNEVFVLTSEIKHALSHLGQWMRNQSVGTPLTLLGSKSYIKYEPKGVCLIISPWNFPFNLTFGPLISAIAAGNTVMIKPSEMTPHSSNVMKKIVESLFSSDEVAIIEGAVETSVNLLKLPFNHIFFTGSPAIGKKVMEAAAKNLSSVTLELGGKSPTIIDESASLKSTCKRLVWGKFLNTGQICIAPDYVYVHEKIKDQFLAEMQKQVTAFYGENPQESDSYSRVVNEKHTERVIGYIQDSVSKGANVICGGNSDQNKNYLAPTIVVDVPKDSALMQNEIFGPVLPILTYTDINEVINEINAGEKPLALYIFSNNNKNIDHVIQNTRAGGTCINNTAVHFFNNNLPFGGSNNSGIGKSHGFFGFQAFSNARGVYRQVIPGAIEMLMPPYSDFKRKLIELTVKFF